MIDKDIAIKSVIQWSTELQSEIFKGHIKPFADQIISSLKKDDQDNAILEAEKSIDKTIADLSEKQSEAIIFENIFLSLINDKIDDNRATEILDSLGYKINPNPIEWLKQKIKGLRNWIIDAISWLKNIGNALDLAVKEISVEIGITPKVRITFISKENKT